MSTGDTVTSTRRPAGELTTAGLRGRKYGCAGRITKTGPRRKRRRERDRHRESWGNRCRCKEADVANGPPLNKRNTSTTSNAQTGGRRVADASCDIVGTYGDDTTQPKKAFLDRGSRSDRPGSPLTLTYDLNLQSQASYGHDSHTHT